MAAKSKVDTPATLPFDGYSRLSQILPFLPIAKSTIESWVKQGKFPVPIKLSPTVTAWKNSDIHAWLDSLSNNENGGAK
ncbi:MAG: AlpA family phage regulatory protein [Pseudomonadota bacterium]|nr:AlpA family phage regulatory protein [Pseudomonadota bacterium]